jgi:DNA-binding transcriptional MerR regulator
MKIGELAERVDVNPRTIRYYESIRLLPPAQRTPSGYRDYGEDDVERMIFIRTAQRLGMSLDEIQEILAVRERGERPCSYVLEVLRQQVADIDRRIADLQRLRADLITLDSEVNNLPENEARYCRIIDHVRQKRTAHLNEHDISTGT